MNTLTLFGYSDGAYLNGVLKAMRKSWSPLIKRAVLVCTDATINCRMDSLPIGDQRIDFESFPPITGYVGYSNFMLKRLHDYFDTTHVMTVHHDGYALDWSKWQDAFLDYDYIGAPWPLGRCLPHRRVGNGGFSIRSHRLSKLSSQLLRDTPLGDNENEDTYLAHHMRDALDKRGIAFAPLELAAQFSIEEPLTDLPSGPGNSFGFHGRHQDWTRALVFWP